MIDLPIHDRLPRRGLVLRPKVLEQRHKTTAVLNFVLYGVREKNTENISCCKILVFKHWSCSHFALTCKFNSSLWYSVKSVVNCGPHSRSGGTTQEIIGSQKRSACRYHSYCCVQYLLHHSHSPSVMRGYSLHKPGSAIPFHSLPRHHRLTTGLTLSLSHSVCGLFLMENKLEWSGINNQGK